MHSQPPKGFQQHSFEWELTLSRCVHPALPPAPCSSTGELPEGTFPVPALPRIPPFRASPCSLCLCVLPLTVSLLLPSPPSPRTTPSPT